MLDITYRNIEGRDFDDLLTLVSEWEVVRQLGGWPWPPNAEFTMGRSKPFEGNGFIWAICDDDRLIGSIGVTDGSIGYMLSSAFSGCGVMSAAVAAAVDHAFNNYELDVISACTWHDNPASAQVLQNAGFNKSGECEEHALARDEMTKSFNFKLSRIEWQTLRSQAQ